ncbi:alanyl-tRNA synthetase [Phascolomyces articulosus]|uniref:Alanine--tRNA ligase n=1 Tax=Phascolomyces articulosus TaxID=60185 RepID=A0AAD5PHX7_9FUNG|nr:alanyl-tRNA synthetase [Phascolomyces articulosus]
MYKVGIQRASYSAPRRLSTYQPIRFIQRLSSPELRSRFTDYFEKQGHTKVKSASLIPHNDKSLLFTNAGMVPFKEYFMKPDTAPFNAATSIQKCMRAGGKHNDLDNVGYTPRHHTFFEMLGNFSFGGYGKQEAIALAWRFLLEELELPISRLRVTVLESDEEGYQLWKKQGLPDEMIVRCGVEDNFWSMGDGEGPCGPCTEIFWDTMDDTLDERWLEIWNLVFMENYRTADGQLTKLPTPCIDTGMGLERMASVLQDKRNNFQVDQFQHLISGLREVLKKKNVQVSTSDDPTAHEKIIADHFRAMCFLISDGVVPSNIGRGYVLRRIIRRALRSAHQVGINEPFLTELYPHLLEGFVDGSYPDLTSRASSICNVIANEETTFLATLNRGLSLLNNIFLHPDHQKKKIISPDVAFQLYDTYGFPFDLTLIIAQEKGWTVDMKAVESLKEKQKAMGRESWKADNTLDKARLSEWRNMDILPQFTGYDHDLLHQESQILAVEATKKGKKTEVTLAIDPCPFYGLGGGQVPDSGTLTLANGSQWNVTDVFQPYEGGIALRVTPKEGTKNIEKRLEEDKEFLETGQLVRTLVDVDKRTGAEIHHTATHLLNAGLRAILKTDIVQAGSTVEPKKLRFDFTYGKPLTSSQLNSVEKWINDAAKQGGETHIHHMKLTEAVETGAIAAFSEKYGEMVRVIEVPGVSRELCGGTHVDNIHRLYPFKILNETSVAAGTRRIEAVAGASCIDWYQKTYEPVPDILKALRASSTKDAVSKLEKSMQQTRDIQKKLDMMTEKLATAGEVIVHPVETRLLDGTVPVRIHLIDTDLDASFMQKRANVLKETQAEYAHVLLSNNNIVVGVNTSKIREHTANSILRHVLKSVKGGGGGQAEYAQGRFTEAISNIKDIESKIVPALKAGV